MTSRRLTTSTALLLTALLVLPTLTGGVHAGGFIERRLYVLAVASTSEGYVGVPSELIVRVSPGEGVVFLSTEPLSEVDMQASARLAALVASYVAGVDYFKHDYYVLMRANSTIVGGPSASAAISVAIAAALLGAELNRSVVMTGAILPDGTIGPVGGIYQKLQAAKEVGAKVVLIPYGQSVVRDLNTGDLVDVVAEGRKMGLKVVEVGTIYEALKWFGINLTRPEARELNLSEDVAEVVRSWVADSEVTYERLIGEVREALEDLGFVPDEVRDLLAEGEKLYESAKSNLESGRLYSAASDLFGAVIDVETALWIVRVSIDRGALEELLAEVRKAVREAREYYEKISDLDGGVEVADLTVLIEVSKRVSEAEKSLRDLEEAVASASLREVIELAVYTKYRALSAIDWGKMLEVVESPNLVVDESRLRHAAALLIRYGLASVAYLNSLGVTDPSVGELHGLLLESEDKLGEDLILSLGLSFRALAYLATTLNSVFAHDIEGRLELLREEALIGASAMVGRGLNPAVAVAYIERGDSVRESEPEIAMYFYDLALINTLGYAVLLGHQVGEVGHVGEVGGVPEEVPTCPAGATTVVTTTVTVTVTERAAEGVWPLGGWSWVERVIVLAVLTLALLLVVSLLSRRGPTSELPGTP